MFPWAPAASLAFVLSQPLTEKMVHLAERRNRLGGPDLQEGILYKQWSCCFVFPKPRGSRESAVRTTWLFPAGMYNVTVIVAPSF